MTIIEQADAAPRSPYMTTEEAARHARMSTRTLQEHTRLGLVPHRRPPHTRIAYAATLAGMDMSSWLRSLAESAYRNDAHMSVYAGEAGQRR
jgi:hypothetical protein